MKIDTVTLKKQVILHLPYLLFLLVFAKLGQTVRLAPGADASQKLLGLSEGFTLAFQSMWPGAALDWLVGLCGAVIMRLAVYLKGKDAKKYRKNVEYGSARWGSKTDIAPFMDQKPENNIILTQSEGLMMSGRPKNPANARNKNVLVVGGSGSGKTRFFIKPNLMQMHSSYIIGQRVCRRNTDETRIVLLKIWQELFSLSQVLFAPNLTGPFCQRDQCLEGKMSCKRKIAGSMTPGGILAADYPLLMEGGAHED